MNTESWVYRGFVIRYEQGYFVTSWQWGRMEGDRMYEAFPTLQKAQDWVDAKIGE